MFRNQFDAQYGAALSAVVTVVTKSGSNRFSGSGFYFGRDQKLNAKNYFATTKPPFNQTRVGGSFGGPILRNRTHFFAAGEHLKVNATAIVALPASNPFATQENGVFATPSRDDMLTLKVDHRASSAHELIGRYLYDNQSLGGIKKPTWIVDGLRLGANSTDDIIHAHSLVVEDNWVLSSNKVNTLRFHLLKDFLGTVPNSTELGHHPPVVQLGPEQHRAAVLSTQHRRRSATRCTSTCRSHDLKFGGELSRASSFRSRRTSTSRACSPSTPTRRSTRQPGDLAVLDDDSEAGVLSLPDLHRSACSPRTTGAWPAGVRLNLGIRYDLDTNMRLNDFFEGLIGDPRFPGIERFISKDRGLDHGNVQPRVGVTWDTRGDGSLVARGGFGVYVTRNRPWFNATVQDMTIGGA